MCPWVHEHGNLLTRTLDRGGNSREADVICYTKGDSLAPCIGSPINGIAVLNLPVVQAPLPAAELAPEVCFSPTDSTRLGPHKYFIAEAYSGANSREKVAKVLQLETLLDFLRARWVDQHEGVAPVEDVTALVGAAAFVFSACDAPRREALRDDTALVLRTVAERCPLLQRLASAGRLLVITLDKTQAPTTFFQRAVASDLRRLASIPEGLEETRAGLEETLAGLEETRAVLEETRAGLEDMRADVRVGLEDMRADVRVGFQGMRDMRAEIALLGESVRALATARD